jgi:FkbM family methyltransferase
MSSMSVMTFIKTLVRAAVPREVRNWLRSPSRSIEWLWDSTKFSFGAREILPLQPGWSIVCHPYARRVAYDVQVSDPDQVEEFRSFVSHCCGGSFLFDIGAHFGIFSLAAAHFGGRAVAVDPSPTATRMIGIQAALNNCANDIQVVRAAVSDVDGTLDLLNSGVFSAGYFSVTRGRPSSELTTTPAITVDELTRQFGAPTHIKIDVEGHEAAVLRGARATLSRFSPILFLELHNEMVVSAGNDPHAALDELAQLGYQTFTSEGDAIGAGTILGRPIIRILAKRRVG